jgi:hypothetical protein
MHLRWRLLHGLGTPALDGLGRAQIGLNGPGSAAAGLLDGRGDELEGSRDGASAASATQQGGRSFTGSFGPGRIIGSGVLPLSCSAIDCLSAWRCGGGGFLPCGCEAAIPSSDDVVRLDYSGRNTVSRLRMAILPTGTGTRGYRTHMGRVWAQFYTHG